MSQAHVSLHHKGVVFASLIPAEEWLYGWYGRCGYATVMTCTPPPADVMALSFDEFDALQRSKSCVLLHDAEGYDVIREDIRLAGSAYRPPTKDIPAMLRVIDARRALGLYAAAHPQESLTLRVTDDADIAANNAYYIISDGAVTQTDDPVAGVLSLTIDALAEFIFKDGKPEMNLMLN